MGCAASVCMRKLWITCGSLLRISGTAPSLSMVLSRSCHETRNVGFTFVMLASVTRRKPTSRHRQHSLRVYFSRIPSPLRPLVVVVVVAVAKTRDLHGSPTPSHDDDAEEEELLPSSV